MTLLACAIVSGVLVLPACGGDEGEPVPDPAVQPAPRQQVKGVERRVGELEAEVEKLRKDLEGVRNERSASVGAGDDAAAAGPAAPAAPEPSSGDGGDAPPAAPTGAAPGASPEAAPRASTAPGGVSGGMTPGGGSGSGSGAAARPGGTDAGGGPDPGTPEDDPSIEDICGPNPAPSC